MRDISRRSLDELQSFLWTHPESFSQVGHVEMPNGHWEPAIGYCAPHVEAYRTRLIAAVVQHFGFRNAEAYPVWAEAEAEAEAGWSPSLTTPES